MWYIRTLPYLYISFLRLDYITFDDIDGHFRGCGVCWLLNCLFTWLPWCVCVIIIFLLMLAAVNEAFFVYSVPFHLFLNVYSFRRWIFIFSGCIIGSLCVCAVRVFVHYVWPFFLKRLLLFNGNVAHSTFGFNYSMTVLGDDTNLQVITCTFDCGDFGYPGAQWHCSSCVWLSSVIQHK